MSFTSHECQIDEKGNVAVAGNRDREFNDLTDYFTAKNMYYYPQNILYKI